MTTANELIEAAAMIVATGMNKDWADTIDAGAVKCAMHVLDTVCEDDDEPVTAEAFAELPGADCIGKHKPFRRCYLSQTKSENEDDYLCAEVPYSDDRKLVVNAERNGSQFKIIDPTWGQLRTLCSALGIPLVEPDATGGAS